MKIFKKLLFLLTLQKRKQVSLFLIMMILITALLDTLAIVSMFAFFKILIELSLIKQIYFFRKKYKLKYK
jgi:hypothetical protein